MLRITRLTFAGLIVAASSTQAQLAPNEMRAHFIDVGQAAATLLEFSCGAVLIDAGAQDTARSTVLLNYLNDVFATRADLQRTLKAVYISHNHIDHTFALMRLHGDNVRIERLIETGRYGSARDRGDTPIEKFVQAEPNVPHRDIDDLDVVQTDVGLTDEDIDPVNCTVGTDPIIRVLSGNLQENPGWALKDFNDKNNHSLVMRVDFGMSSFLFTGDLEEPAIEDLVDYYAGTPMLDTDVVMIGHHGSANGTTTGLMKAVKKPRFAVIAMGACTERTSFTAWDHGHPRKSAVDIVTKEVAGTRTPKSVSIAIREGTAANANGTFIPMTMKKAVYGTGWDGNVVLSATAGAQMTVTTSKSTAPSC